ncbi:hypothetical protein NDU88_009821 [Pleurodeles waltl]|uniref:Uncharacterized protein n=1 Tax=Pleurodeles waltl TaxID=8319 RepID=A0AAV7RZI6_PLEWA|nr:hypothetical protein NDU88_009821 [Pleurodeles waltl]
MAGKTRRRTPARPRLGSAALRPCTDGPDAEEPGAAGPCACCGIPTQTSAKGERLAGVPETHVDWAGAVGDLLRRMPARPRLVLGGMVLRHCTGGSDPEEPRAVGPCHRSSSSRWATIRHDPEQQQHCPILPGGGRAGRVGPDGIGPAST